jgi:hypothetical protein
MTTLGAHAMTHPAFSAKQHVFGPTDICAMRTALDSALGALAFSFANDGPDATTRDEIARAIVRYAAGGELNPIQLSALVLHELAPRPAYWVTTHERRMTA